MNTALERAMEIAKPFENLVLHAYWDPHPHGLPTQGWGRLLTRYSLKMHLSEGKTRQEADLWLRTTYPDIDKNTADRWLMEDMSKAYRGVLKYARVPLSVGMEAALTDFAYNVGVGALQSSTLLRMINRFEYEEAADQFKRWNKSGGVVLRGLTRRRSAEREAYLT
jgi:lysozyme